MAALRCGKVEIDGRDGDASATMLRLIDRLAERGVDERTRDRHADEEHILCIDDVIASDIFVGCYPVLPSIIHTPPNEPGELNFRDLGLGTVDILHLVSDINRDKIIVWGYGPVAGGCEWIFAGVLFSHCPPSSPSFIQSRHHLSLDIRTNIKPYQPQ